MWSAVLAPQARDQQGRRAHQSARPAGHLRLPLHRRESRQPSLPPPARVRRRALRRRATPIHGVGAPAPANCRYSSPAVHLGLRCPGKRCSRAPTRSAASLALLRSTPPVPSLHPQMHARPDRHQCRLAHRSRRPPLAVWYSSLPVLRRHRRHVLLLPSQVRRAGDPPPSSRLRPTPRGFRRRHPVSSHSRAPMAPPSSRVLRPAPVLPGWAAGRSDCPHGWPAPRPVRPRRAEARPRVRAHRARPPPERDLRLADPSSLPPPSWRGDRRPSR